MSPSDRLRLEHMLSAANGAIGAAAGRSPADLDLSNDFTLALVKRVEIVGEAAGRVAIETQVQFLDIPWQKITSTRHRLVHAYDAIDLQILWSIVSLDLPPLIQQLERALASSD